jgi:hypothetical protein
MIKLKPNPTFLAKVTIPAAGMDPLVIEMEFKHMTKTQFIAWAGSKLPDIDATMEIAAGWRDVDESFSKEAVAFLLENYQPAAFAIFETYARELRLGREKN